MPKIGPGLIGFDDATVVGVGDERVAIGEPARKGHTAEEHAAGLYIRVHDSAWSGVRDFKGLVVGLVGDEDVSIDKQFGGVGVVESIVLPHDGLIGATHLDDAIVSLIGDQHMIVPIRLRQICVLHRNAELIEPRTSDAECSILPDDVVLLVHEHHAIVDATIRGRAQWFGAARRPGTRHESKRVHSFGIVGANNRVRRNIGGTVSKMPDDVTRRVNLDDAVVELIRNKNIARLIKSALGARGSWVAQE